MASLTQLLSKKGEASIVAAPRWHPNFRNYEKLPDTKVVRTTFFVNTAAIAITVGLLLWTGFREYRINNLSQQVADSQSQIDSNKLQNAEALATSKKFADEYAKVQEAIKFSTLPIEPSEFVVLLGKTLPKEVSIDTIDMKLSDAKNPSITLRGGVTGAPDQAMGAVSSYVDIFRNNPELAAIVAKAEITTVNRDPRTGAALFEIALAMRKEKESK